MTLRKFSIGRKRFVVEDTPATNQENFDFWGWFSSGQWETTTIEEADKLLHKGDLLFDIGAWVGPLTLWEASRGVKVVAVEPDPVAFDLLRQNVIINGFKDLVTLVNKAIVYDASSTVTLNFRGSGGDAWSSIAAREDLPNSIEVQATTITELIKQHGKPAAIKMDIEGGESIILPVIGPLLRRLKIPLLLATHAQWYIPWTEQNMVNELSHWHSKDLHNQMYLLKAK